MTRRYERKLIKIRKKFKKNERKWIKINQNSKILILFFFYLNLIRFFFLNRQFINPLYSKLKNLSFNNSFLNKRFCCWNHYLNHLIYRKIINFQQRVRYYNFIKRIIIFTIIIIKNLYWIFLKLLLKYFFLFAKYSESICMHSAECENEYVVMLRGVAS